jgi:hypothetical protein
MSKYNATIKYSKTFNDQGFPQYHFKVYTDVKEYAKISGHRFVSLVDDNSFFRNDLDVILGFLKMQPPAESEYITCGNILEPKIIDFATHIYDLKDVKTFSFEDLDNGTSDFHFIRDLEYINENGEQVTGEVKTFYNRKKLDWHGNSLPEPHISWWLQTRLELEILKPEGGKGRIFYYYVTPGSREKIVKGKDHNINPKYFFASDYIVKPKDNTPEEMIVNNFKEQGFTTFRELMDYALIRREDLMTLYEDEEGTFYQATADIQYHWFDRYNHIENQIKELSKYFTIEEI